ncbi:MAG: hypothetical protein KAS23_09165, partial [Anaerohalosphaera sp.]|nr:hypothetical protein [Anaerohalosphaera sp.]
QYGEASTAEATLTATSGTQWQYIGEIIIPETGLHYIFLRFPVLAGSQSGQVEAIRLEGAGQITQGVAWTGRAAAAFYAVGEYTSSRRTKYVEMIPRPWPTPNIGGTHTVASISGSYSHNNSNVAFSLWQSNGLNPTPLVAFGGTRIFTHEGEGSTIELDDFYLDPTRRRKVLIFMTPDGSGNTITAVCAGEVGQGWYLVGRMREYASKTLGSGYGFIENFSVFNAHYYQRACAWGNSWSFGSHSGQNSWLENKSVSADFKNPADNPDPFTTGVYRWGKSGLKQDMVEITIGGQLEQINNGNKIYYTLPSGRPMPVLPTLNLVCTLNEQDEIYQLDDAQVNSNYSENVSTRIKDPFSSIGFNFQKISGPAWLTVSSNGLLSGRPAIGDSGQNLIEIEVYSNNMGLSGIFTIGIYVAAPGNNAPVFLDHPTEVQTVATADDPVLLTFPLHDPDATDTLTLSVVSGDLSGVFGIDQATKSLIKVSVPVADQVYPLTLELSDGTETVTTNVDVTVVQGDGRGGATKDVWYMSIGTTVAELENDPRYPDDPNWTGAVGDLTEDYMGKSTGYRIRGYIYPPVTGSYTFWMTGAQAGEFWLSSDQSSGNIVKRAGFSPTSSSSLVTLSVGQRYYFEALAKCGNYNTGNLQVDWQGPGLFRQVIAGEYISPIEYVRPEYSENTIALREVLVGEPYQENMRTKLKTLDMWDVLVYEKLSGPEWVVVSSDGMLTGTPDDLDVGVNSVLLRATVPGGLYDEVTLEINVNANNAPVFNADPIVLADINENSAYNKSLRSYASDINTGVHFGFGDRLTFGIVSGPGWLHISDDGQLYGTPTDNDAGLNIWTVRVTDLGGLTAETQLEFEVLSQNDYPEFVSDPILMSVMLGDAVVGSLADQCHDPDVGDVLTFSKDDGPAWLIVGEDGSLSGMPADIDEGDFTFTVTADDGNGGSDQAILKINVLTGVWFVHEPFDGSPGADVIGSAGGTGFDGAWVLGSDGSAGAFTFAGTGMTFTDIETSGLKTVYDPISGATTRYKRSLVSAVTVDAVTTEVWASALVEIGSGSGD